MSVSFLLAMLCAMYALSRQCASIQLGRMNVYVPNWERLDLLMVLWTRNSSQTLLSKAEDLGKYHLVLVAKARAHLAHQRSDVVLDSLIPAKEKIVGLDFVVQSILVGPEI
jgi:hypothetical protein